jgi:hypothetical protein
MTDFSWTQNYALIPSRMAVQAAFEQVGFQFSPTPETISAGQRPRTTGGTADQRARIELIGPADVVFKATILIRVAETANMLDSQADLLYFLSVVAPAWEAGPAWLLAHLATLGEQAAVTTRYRDLVIALRTARRGLQLVLGVTWQPQGSTTVEPSSL